MNFNYSNHNIPGLQRGFDDITPFTMFRFGTENAPFLPVMTTKPFVFDTSLSDLPFKFHTNEYQVNVKRQRNVDGLQLINEQHRLVQGDKRPLKKRKF
ncbi:unnamed protein product [Rhizopus stolonifer]